MKTNPTTKVTARGRFEKGDTIVYVPHGIGKIIDIVSLGDKQCYSIEFQNGMNCIIPTDTNGRLRKISPATAWSKIKNTLGEVKRVKITGPWIRRQKEFHEKIKFASAEQIAEILRDLRCIARKKPLSFWERSAFDNALSILVQEFSISLKKQPEEIKNEILQALRIKNLSGIFFKPKNTKKKAKTK